MAAIPGFPVDLSARMVAWRHMFHQHPETGFEEHQTSESVGQLLENFGFTVHRRIGGTGVVASLKVGDGKRVVALRADMDALNIGEAATDRPYASRVNGKMHACGHDGHMAMLLGAAALIRERQDFNGTVRLIFQPAEEHGRGAKAMLDDRLLERFPIDEIYGLHNWPGLPAGQFATCVGGIMASEDNFVIRIRGRGMHAARPHMGIDPIVAASQIILALQTIVSRSLDPSLPAVVSCTEIHTDGIRNAVPTNVVIKGDTRSYSPDVQKLLESRMREICDGIAGSCGAHCEVEYTHEFAPTVNSAACVPVAVAAATNIVGGSMVDGNTKPAMASEDFGAFLEAIPGAFVFLGNGTAPERGGCPLHSPAYDFNDDILELGARYFAEIPRLRLGNA